MTTANEMTQALDAFYERSLRPEFERLNGRADVLDERVGRLEERVGQVDERVSQLAVLTANRFQDLADRIHAVSQRLETFRIEALDRFGDLYAKFQLLSDEYHLITAALRRLETEGSPVERAQWERLTHRLDEVERRLRDVEARVAGAPTEG
jgi:tetrahydromethanopterin S-methyltransferase subunit G